MVTEWLSRHRVLTGGVLLVLAQLVYRWWWVSGSFFWQDDFRYLAQAKEGLSAEVLLQDYNGHLMPGAFLVSWLVGEAGSSYGVALAILLVLQTLVGLLLAWAIHLLFPERVLGLVVLAAALFTPLTLVGVAWYAFGLQVLPMQAATLGCLICLIHWRRTHQIRWVLGLLVIYVAGLFFWEKALLILPSLVLVTVLLFERSMPVRSRLRALLADWKLWGPMVALTGAYVVLYLNRVEAIGSSGARPDVDGGALLVAGVLRTLLPGLVGGPWNSTGGIFTLSPVPHVTVTVLVAVFWLALIALTVWRHRARAAQAWLLFIGLVSLDYGLLLALRWFLEFAARDSRYIADAVPLLAIAVLAAFHRTADEHEESSDQVTEERPLPRAVSRLTVPAGWRLPAAAAAVAVLSAGSVLTSQLASERLIHTYARNYVTAVDGAVETDPSRPTLNYPTPTSAVFFGRLEELATAMGFRPAVVEAGQDMQMFDPIGQPRAVTIPADREEFSERGPQEGCGWLLKGKDPVTIPVRGDYASDYERVLQIGYLSNQSYPITISAEGTAPTTLDTPDGLGILTVRLTSKPTSLRISGAAGDTNVCLSEVRIGPPSPKTD